MSHLGEDAFHAQAISDERPGLSRRARVGVQGVHRRRQLVVEQLRPGGRPELPKGRLPDEDLFLEAMEEICMLALLPEPGRQEQLVVESPFVYEHLREREQVARDGLLAVDEQRGTPEQQRLFLR